MNDDFRRGLERAGIDQERLGKAVGIGLKGLSIAAMLWAVMVFCVAIILLIFLILIIASAVSA